ncbi:hypothetical protein BDV93DRAFT_522725 [Ceratobasidium sp. AG-I]|nr:hypothetical protein BDV93DRAFT_522725 [Ceratobasidium sp. AG-I]
MTTGNTSTRSEGQSQAWANTGLPTLVSQAPQRPGITHILLFTSLFIPLVFLPYIPLRRHMQQQTRQLETLRSQLEVLRSQLSNQFSTTKENSRKLAATIHENRQLGQQLQGLRAEFLKIDSRLDRLQEENKEKAVRDQSQNEWNKKILAAIDRMQKDIRPLTAETFAQRRAAFMEEEERRNGLFRRSDEDD